MRFGSQLSIVVSGLVMACSDAGSPPADALGDAGFFEARDAAMEPVPAHERDAATSFVDSGHEPVSGDSVAPPIRASQVLQSSESFSLPPVPFADVHPEGGDSPGHASLMHSFAASIGSDTEDDCNHCHVDWHDESVRINETTRIARHMWDDILGKLELADGQPFYCDSCHQGRAKFLDRSNPKAVEAWMQANMVDKLRRRDGQKHDCTTCHGAAPDAYDALLETWSREP
jgi:hypothetical protein